MISAINVYLLCTPYTKWKYKNKTNLPHSQRCCWRKVPCTTHRSSETLRTTPTTTHNTTLSF